MNKQFCLLTILVAALSCSVILAQARKTSIPEPIEDRYVTEDFGNCTLAIGKDRSKYVQPFVTCTAGRESFRVVPQENGQWAILITPGDEIERSKEEERNSSLAVTIKIDDNDSHELSMLWPKRMNMALQSFELPELVGLLDELRKGNSMTVSRNGQAIEFNLYRANEAFTELVFAQLVALSKSQNSH